MGHSYTTVETVKANCCTKAYTKQVCKRCGDIREVTGSTNPNDHTGCGVRVEEIPPSCGVAGYEHYYCKGCGEWINSVIIPHLLHSYTEVIERKEPTATQDGYIKYKCVNCGDIKTIVLEATGK